MNWEEIYSGIRSFAGRAATKINQTADMATLQVKLSMAEHKLEETYAALGRASFGHFVEDKENFAQIPNELYYAAKVDGTTDFRYLMRVMVPICKPTLITITILKVIECWNSYVWPRLVTDEENRFLVSNGIQSIRENGFGRENIPAMMAAVVVISVPLIGLFLIFRKKIMAGVSRGGLKG